MRAPTRCRCASICAASSASSSISSAAASAVTCASSTPTGTTSRSRTPASIREVMIERGGSVLNSAMAAWVLAGVRRPGGAPRRDALAAEARAQADELRQLVAQAWNGRWFHRAYAPGVAPVGDTRLLARGAAVGDPMRRGRRGAGARAARARSTRGIAPARRSARACAGRRIPTLARGRALGRRHARRHLVLDQHDADLGGGALRARAGVGRVAADDARGPHRRVSGNLGGHALGTRLVERARVASTRPDVGPRRCSRCKRSRSTTCTATRSRCSPICGCSASSRPTRAALAVGGGAGFRSPSLPRRPRGPRPHRDDRRRAAANALRRGRRRTWCARVVARDATDT